MANYTRNEIEIIISTLENHNRNDHLTDGPIISGVIDTWKQILENMKYEREETVYIHYDSPYGKSARKFVPQLIKESKFPDDLRKPVKEQKNLGMNIFVGTPNAPAIGKWLNLEDMWYDSEDDEDLAYYIMKEITKVAGKGRDWIFSDHENMWPGFDEIESVDFIAEYIHTILWSDDPELTKGCIDALKFLEIDTIQECIENWEDWVVFHPDQDLKDLAMDFTADRVNSMACGLSLSMNEKQMEKEKQWVLMYMDYDALARDMDIEGTYLVKSEGLYEIIC